MKAVAISLHEGSNSFTWDPKKVGAKGLIKFKAESRIS